MTGATELPRVQVVSALLWPSFLLAGAATGIFFTFLDPLVLFECKGEPPLSRLAAYSLAFFGFWLLCAASSAASTCFLRPQKLPGRAGGSA